MHMAIFKEQEIILNENANDKIIGNEMTGTG